MSTGDRLPDDLQGEVDKVLATLRRDDAQAERAAHVTTGRLLAAFTVALVALFLVAVVAVVTVNPAGPDVVEILDVDPGTGAP